MARRMVVLPTEQGKWKNYGVKTYLRKYGKHNHKNAQGLQAKRGGVKELGFALTGSEPHFSALATLCLLTPALHPGTATPSQVFLTCNLKL